MWTAVLTIGTPLGHGITSPSTAAHSASDLYLLLLTTLATGPQVGAQTLDTGAIRQGNEHHTPSQTKWNSIVYDH